MVATLRDNRISYYCNLASPYRLDEEALKCIVYELDVYVFADGDNKSLDVDEYVAQQRKLVYSADIDYILKDSVKFLVDWICHQNRP